MDLVISGHLQHDSEVRAIRDTIIRKRESLQCIEREIAQLVETKKEVEQDLVRLRIALAPHTGNHSLFSQSKFSVAYSFRLPWIVEL